MARLGPERMSLERALEACDVLGRDEPEALPSTVTASTVVTAVEQPPAAAGALT